MEKIYYDRFKAETDKMCKSNKKIVIGLIEQLNNNTFNLRKGFDGICMDTEMIPNPFVLWHYITWISEFYAQEEKHEFRLEVEIFLHQTKEGEETLNKIARLPYSSIAREELNQLKAELEMEVL